MMVETILESSQDFGMSGSGPTPGGALPQWKRELLQRRALRPRPPAPPPAPPPPPPPPATDDDEELRYGPGIVKRLKSRYLSLALRDAPRRRPSVLRRAASLEHLLEPRPPPAPRPAARAPRPASLTALHPAHQSRRDFVKRARSVDALSRLEPRDEPPPSPPPAPPAPPPPPPAPPRPSSRPPRRPAPLLRETERPPPDLVRSTLRKFEPAPVRRAAPAARVSAALRGLERGAPPTPEPRSPSPGTPALDARSPDEPEATSTPRPVSRAALEGIARAGCTTRYSFEAGERAPHLPPPGPLAAANPVLLSRARRVGVIRPMPAPARERAISAPFPVPPAEEPDEKTVEEPPRITDATPRIIEELRPASPAASELDACSPPRADRREPPSALVEPIPRSPPTEPPPPPPTAAPEPAPGKTEIKPDVSPKPKINKLMNGHAEPQLNDPKPKETIISRVNSVDERPWNGVTLKKTPVVEPKPTETVTGAPRKPPPRAGRGAAPPPSVVFNFSHRKEVPDYIENDGIILRAPRRERIKAGEPGVVVLDPSLVSAQESDGEGEEGGEGGGPPSPLSVRFVNDNVLINGRSSMPGARDRDRVARLKLQFDDSLTRTFEYPSETSFCEEGDEPVAAPAPCPAPVTPAPATPAAPLHSALTANTHLVSGALGRYTPHKTCADAFQLGVTRHAPATTASTASTDAKATAELAPTENGTCPQENGGSGGGGEECGGVGVGAGGGVGDARPCAADSAHCWSETRTLATDLLF